MLTSFKDRKGSALLIVLGMFSFMLVSAVAFSVYMRASRAPSSYVRRNASARHLVKAALARAMDEIDTAIGNDPFPGVGYNHEYGGSGINDANNNKNDNWHGHVFTPSNEVAAVSTVSTLTLEALGYLPACLIDEARYWSRHTRTAQWRSFNYGLGQYAFTAVNVSDLFDLNQLIDTDGVAKQRLNRNSSPTGRISPAYLFRSSNTGDMDSGGAGAAAFLSALASGSGFGVTPSLMDVPFVSMLDFNLALGTKALGGIASPFMDRLNGRQGRFYSVGEDVVRRQVFMAGGWNSDTNLTYSEYNTLGRINLRYNEYQPFDGYSWFPEATTLSHCYNDVAENHPFWRPMNENFPVLATALLCDYLDYDNVPLSLCIPCAEAVPMLCGVELNSGNCVKYKVTYQQGPEEPDGETGKKRIDTCLLEVQVPRMEVTLTAVYPFANGQQGRSDTFTASAFARVFFTAASGNAWEKGLRTSNADLGLGDGFTWNVANDNNAAAFLQVVCNERAVNAKESDTEEAAIQGDIALNSSSLSKTYELAKLTYRKEGEDGNWQFVGAEDSRQFNFYDEGWTRVDFGALFQAAEQGNVSALRFKPSVAVWARIKCSDGDKTVDMVPATAQYDNLNQQAANAGLNGFARATGSNAGTPLLRFFANDAADGVEISGTYFQSGREVDTQWAQTAYIANDPRINWAPEQWWASPQAGDPKQLWLDNVKTFRTADTTRDSDIFMAVSNQGYLQSMYEWMMVPQVRSLTTTANPEWGAFEGGGGYNGVVRTAVGEVAHDDLMWRTYRAEALGYNSNLGRLDDLPFDEAENGLRVNPYTDITNVMLGAFANMPNGWWAAGTNHLAAGKNYMNGTSFKKDYLFDWSCTYQDVYRMTAYWMGAFRRRDNQAEQEKLYRADDWKDVFEDAWNWREGRVNHSVPDVPAADIEGILQDDMTFADRKFLYGYLKGCFANTSQLFLLFVRAESAAGGGGAGSGARAVALVWRDPKAPVDSSGQYKTAMGGSEAPTYGKDNAQKYLNVASGRSEESWRLNERKYPPHKMRILFYHQLD